MYKRSQDPSDVDGLISELLGEPHVSSEPDDFSEPEDSSFQQQLYYQLPLRHTQGGSFIDDNNKPWIVGHFYPGKFLNETHPGGHNGVDLKAPEGSPIYPIGPGTVVKVVSDWKSQYGIEDCEDYISKKKKGMTKRIPTAGNLVAIEHEDGNVRSLYLHLDEASVSVGQEVGLSTVIGTVGQTGNAMCRGAHLHYEVRVNGSLIDPITVKGKPVGSLTKKAFFISRFVKELEKKDIITLRRIAEDVGFEG